VTTPRENERIAEQADETRMSPAPMIVKWLDTAEKHDYPAAASYLAQIADGCHRVCASYYTDEDTDIPVKIVKL
jgi:hypothetical protein